MKYEQPTEREKGMVLGMVAYGCEPEVAAYAAGWREGHLQQVIAHDPEFAKELAQHEGSVELRHMKSVHAAAAEVKYWRASAWWLARRSAERRDRKQAKVLTTAEWSMWLEGLIELVLCEVQSDDDRDRLLMRLHAVLSAQDSQTVRRILGEAKWQEEFGDVAAADG